jgi:hypothetical protein
VSIEGGRYNQSVRRFATVLVLAAFASLNAIDAMECPDGCTHEPGATWTPSTPQTPDGACLLCAGGLSSPVPKGLLPGAPVMSRVATVAVTSLDDVPADPPEHPPRV